VDAWQIGFLSLAEVEGLVQRIFGCWPAERRDSCWLKAYTRASSTIERWEQEIRAELVDQGAMMDDGDDGDTLSTQPGAAKSSREGATRVVAGRPGRGGASLVDSVCAVKIAAVDELLQEAHAKGRGKEGNSP